MGAKPGVPDSRQDKSGVSGSCGWLSSMADPGAEWAEGAHMCTVVCSVFGHSTRIMASPPQEYR